MCRKRRRCSPKCAAETLQQVVRRLGILDEEYGFIRTDIFWVRDQDPIGFTTLAKAAREFNYLLYGLLRLAEESVKANLWCRPSAEFLVAGLARLRRRSCSRGYDNRSGTYLPRSTGAALLSEVARRSARQARTRSFRRRTGRHERRSTVAGDGEREETNENTREVEGGSLMRALRSLALKLTRASIWPGRFCSSWPTQPGRRPVRGAWGYWSRPY